MAWTIKFSEFAQKQMKKLDKPIAKRIIDYLGKRIINQSDPRLLGKALLHDKTGLWRYRMDDYRIIVKIQDNECTVLVLRVGHRREIYRKN